MKPYKKPEISVESFKEDILTSSGPFPSDDDFVEE